MIGKSTPPFFLGNDRAMISLGPLSNKKYCTYSCPFCYVEAGFTKYIKLDEDEIIDWLVQNRDSYNIVYISGDTDSFAPPRTESAINLLNRLTKLKVDLLFTTRYVFDLQELQRIIEINEKLNSQNNLLFGCVSISQLRTPFIEPKPIPSIQERFNQLAIFKKRGIVSVLAMRPFLPITPYEDYAELVDNASGRVDLILGERWHSDFGGILENKIMIKSNPDYTIEETEMDFDNNQKKWRVWKNSKLENQIKEKCNMLNIPFFMRSKPAVEWYKKNRESI